MSGADHSDQLTLHGIVLATDWDDDGEPLRVAIHAANETVYEVEPVGAGERLVAHLRHEVVARVVLLPGSGRRQLVEVLDYTVVHPGAHGPGATDTAAPRAR